MTCSCLAKKAMTGMLKAVNMTNEATEHKKHLCPHILHIVFEEGLLSREGGPFVGLGGHLVQEFLPNVLT